jgi:hypothetical protein
MSEEAESDENVVIVAKTKKAMKSYSVQVLITI